VPYLQGEPPIEGFKRDGWVWVDDADLIESPGEGWHCRWSWV